MYTTRDYNTQPWREYIVLPLLAVFSFLVLLVASPDSWLHVLWDHHDSAWFFTCGKAWMSGMVPYVDFADSKGPLLWLIYGIGYLISPRDMIGVFVLSCLLYTATFYCCYKMAMLLLHDSGKSMLATLCMACMFFFPGVHYEVRAEDFSMLFTAMSLYQLLRITRDEDVPLRAVRRAPWVLGASLAATLLIKYNATLMLLLPALYVVLAARRHRQAVWQSLWRMAAGAALVLVPFMVYMLCVGCFDDFIREYFVNTFATLQNSTYKPTHAWGIIRRDYLSLSYVCLLVVLLAVAFIGLYRDRWMLLSMATWYAAIMVNNARWTYYYEAVSIFALFGFVALLSLRWNRKVVVTAIVLAFVGIPAALGGIMMRIGIPWYNTHDVQRADFARCISEMSQVERPRVLYFLMNGSYDIPVDGLPACRYWASQNGSTEEMNAMQRETIEKGRADFVFMLPSFKMNSRMDSLGYDRIDSHCDEIMVMYKNKKLNTN